MEAALQTRGLGKQYSNGAWGLLEVSLDFQFGSLVALLGANGSGKSTLIHALCGALQPTTGEVLLNPSLGRGGIGWCSQRQSLDWYLTAYDNVLLGARLAGLNRTDSARQTRHALEIAGLGQHQAAFADELSGGQQKRIQIARALVANPAVLFLMNQQRDWTSRLRKHCSTTCCTEPRMGPWWWSRRTILIRWSSGAISF